MVLTVHSIVPPALDEKPNPVAGNSRGKLFGGLIQEKRGMRYASWCKQPRYFLEIVTQFILQHVGEHGTEKNQVERRIRMRKAVRVGVHRRVRIVRRVSDISVVKRERGVKRGNIALAPIHARSVDIHADISKSEFPQVWSCGHPIGYTSATASNVE
jgi:hypothetical protein